MTNKTLESIAGGITVVSLATATLGVVGTGIYEGVTGNKIFGAENPTVFFAALAGYTAPVVSLMSSTIAEGTSSENDEAILGALICPIGPIVSAALYGVGYGVGKLFS